MNSPQQTRNRDAVETVAFDERIDAEREQSGSVRRQSHNDGFRGF